PAAHESRPGALRNRSHAAHRSSATRRRSPVCGPARWWHHARGDVCRRADVHSQLEHRRQVVAARGAGLRGRVVGGAVGGGSAIDPVIHVGMSARLHDVMACRRAVVQTCIALLLTFACATAHLPAQLHGYVIVVEERDPQSVELARALRERGVKVRARVRGGSGRTAALFYFMYSDPGPGQTTRFYVRRGDARSGAVVSGATIQLDSTTSTQRARAVAAVRAL